MGLWRLKKNDLPYLLLIALLCLFFTGSLISSLITTLVVNSVRIAMVTGLHRWISPVIPDKYGDITHLLLGVTVFLPALILIHHILETHGKSNDHTTG